MARNADTARMRTTRTLRRGPFAVALMAVVGLAAAGPAAAATPSSAARVTDGTSNTVIFAEATRSPDGIIAVLIGL